MNLLNSKNQKKHNKITPCALIAACAMCGVAAIHTGAVQAGAMFPMQEFNVIILGTPNVDGSRNSVGTFQDNSDIQGSVFINGSVSGSTFAGNGLPNGDSIGLEATGSIPISSSVNINQGSVLLGGTAPVGYNPNSKGAVVQNSAQPAADLANFSSTLTSASDQWATLGATSGTSVTLGNSEMSFNVPIDAGAFVVFDISASNFAQNDGIIFSGLNSNQQVLINVSGTSFTEPGGINYNGNSTLADNVLWNFSQATSINFQSGFYGSILAPDATLTTSSTIYGNVAVANLNPGEVDFASPGFSSPPPLNAIPAGGSLPVPASFGLVGIGSLAMLVGLAIRKRLQP